MAEKEIKKTEAKLEREYIIPLRDAIARVARYKRANKAVKTIKEFLARHMKVQDRDLNKVKIEKHLNEYIWSRGIRNPPAKIKVKVTMEGDIVKAELAELTEKLKFKMARLEKRNTRAMASAEERKKAAKEEKKEEPTEEKKEETEEKQAAVIEAGAKMEKAASKTMKHSSQDQKKKATTPRRMALQK